MARTCTGFRFSGRSDECRRGEIAGRVEHGRKSVGNCVDRNKDANAFCRKTDREK